MRYFLDTEFLEGTQKTWFGQSKPTIDLISIGIVCEDGREYYAISKDFNLKEAWNRFQLENDTTVGARIGCLPPKKKVYWIRDNVLKPIFVELFNKLNNRSKMLLSEDGLILSPYNFKFTYKNIKKLINKYGKSNKQIAEEIKDFTLNYGCDTNENGDVHIKENIFVPFKPEFYGYYSDYDWVVFCWLFGKMIDLPNGFPMYCRDLKQTLDELQDLENVSYVHELKCNSTTISPLKVIKDLPNYPKQINEHSAIHDARWNYELYKFLNTL